jgi:hypothetical protein
MYIYFKEEDMDIVCQAITSSTDKENLLKRFENKYRLNVYDLSFKERCKFFYQFLNLNIEIEQKEIYYPILFSASENKSMLSIFSELQKKYKKREDVVFFVSTSILFASTGIRTHQLFFSSKGDMEKERAKILKTMSEDVNLKYKKSEDVDDRC